MFFMVNYLGSCQNKQGSREGGRDRELVCVSVFKMEWGMRREIQTWQMVAAFKCYHGALVTACCSSATRYFLLDRATLHYASLLFCFKAEQGSIVSIVFNRLREKSCCFTLKWVSINSCFHNSVAWSVRPDITDSIQHTTPYFSIVLLFMQKPMEQLSGHINQIISWSCSWQQFPV